MFGKWVIVTLVVTLATLPVFGEFLLPENTKFSAASTEGVSDRAALVQDETDLYDDGDEDDPFFTFDWGFGDDDEYTGTEYDDDEDAETYVEGEDTEDDFDGEYDEEAYEDEDNLEDDDDEIEDGEDEIDYDGDVMEELEREIEEAEEEDENDMSQQWMKHISRMRNMNSRWRRMLQRALHGQMTVNPYVNVKWDLRMLAEKNKWWNGPNVCKRTEEDEEDMDEDSSIVRHHMISSSVCDDTGTVYKCTTEVKMFSKKKKMSVIYECCHGFQRQDGEFGCTKELPVRTLMETLDHLEADDVLQSINSIAPLTDFINDGNFTIFAPIGGIFNEMMTEQTNNIVVVTPELMEMAKDLEETIMALISPGFMKTAYMEDEQLVSTLSQDNNIRINIYERPKMLVTANCRPVVSSDNMAYNGVVHLVDGTLSPVKESIASIVSKNPDLSMFKTVLGHSGLLSLLKKDGQLTLMVPSNSAFNRMNPDLRQKLLSGEQCIRDIVRHHLLPNVICSSILNGRLTTVNLLNHKLSVVRDEQNKLFVEDAQVLDTDIMATNGVIHIIDDLLIPDEARTLLDIISDQVDSETFLDLLNVTDLSKKFTQLHNFTLFMPKQISAVHNQWLLDNPEELADTLLYHVLPSGEYDADLEHRSEHSTLLHERHVSVRNFKNFPFGLQSKKTVQCAVIEKTDIGVCGGVVHMIDRVMTPPSGDVLDTLQDRAELSEFVRLLKAAGVTETIRHHAALTVFAPTNKAFNELGDETMKFLGEHPEELKDFLLHHMTHDAVCCSGIFDDILSETRTTLDDSVVLTRRQDNRAHVNQVPITTCDVMANNGIVHVIDSVLPAAVYRYVTRHLRHDGSLNWHTHHAGDNFGLGLENYVQNILGIWFGPKKAKPGVQARTKDRLVPDQAEVNNQKSNGRRFRPDASDIEGLQRRLQNAWDRPRGLQLGRDRPSVSPRMRNQHHGHNVRRSHHNGHGTKVTSILDNYGLPHNIRRHSTRSHGANPQRRHRGPQKTGFAQRRLQLAQKRRLGHARAPK